MSTKLDKIHEPLSSPPETIDGEIFVNLRNPRVKGRAVIFFSLLALSLGSALFAGFAQSASIEGSRKFTKGDTQCPGMSPAQKAAAAVRK